MRAINKFEKDIIKRILSFNKSGITPNIVSVIDPLLKDKDIVLDFKNREVELRADIQYYNQGNIIEIVQQITKELITTVNLLEYLEKNGYVATFQESDVDSPFRYGQLVQGHQYITYNFVDSKLKELLLDYSLKSILVNQELIDFVKYGYQSKTDYNTQRSIKIAVVSLIVTASLSVIGLVFNYISLPPTTIDKQSIHEILKPVNKIYLLDSLENNEQNKMINKKSKDSTIFLNKQVINALTSPIDEQNRILKNALKQQEKVLEFLEKDTIMINNLDNK